jgi:hypothetical protein
LPARPIEQAQEVPLGRLRGLRRTLALDAFAFDAQELGDTPALLIGVRSRQRLVDNRQPFGKPYRHDRGRLQSQLEVEWFGGMQVNAVRRSSNPPLMSPRLMSNRPPKHRPPRFHSSTGVRGGKIHECSYVALRQDQIADEKRDGAG